MYGTFKPRVRKKTVCQNTDAAVFGSNYLRDSCQILSKS